MRITIVTTTCSRCLNTWAEWAPPSLNWAGYELLAGNNSTAGFYLTTQFMLRIIDRLGTAEQKLAFCPRRSERRWNCTMVLTEPDAGSDVGAGKTRARHVEGDEWHIEGVKRFITGGDNDYFENIIHGTRPSRGSRPRHQRSVAVLVPKFWVEKDGSMGARNGVRTTKVEHKMGIKASATCELVFGDETPARGLLLSGNVHDGIRQMFKSSSRPDGDRRQVDVHVVDGISECAQVCARTNSGVRTSCGRWTSRRRASNISPPDVRRMLLLQSVTPGNARAVLLRRVAARSAQSCTRRQTTKKSEALGGAMICCCRW